MSDFGNKVMQWGTGDAAAHARIQTITLGWLLEQGVTKEMLQAWVSFYESVYHRDPGNSSARGRAELIRHCVRLYEGLV